MNKLVPWCAWFLSDALESLRLRSRLRFQHTCTFKFVSEQAFVRARSILFITFFDCGVTSLVINDNNSSVENYKALCHMLMPRHIEPYNSQPTNCNISINSNKIDTDEKTLKCLLVNRHNYRHPLSSVSFTVQL